MRLNPYKYEHNNRIEILGTLAGMITLFSGIIFVEDETVELFTVYVAILIFMFNASFLLNWIYLFMLSWNIKNQTFNKITNLYGTLICRKINLTNNINPNSNTKSKKMILTILIYQHIIQDLVIIR